MQGACCQVVSEGMIRTSAQIAEEERLAKEDQLYKEHLESLLGLFESRDVHMASQFNPAFIEDANGRPTPCEPKQALSERAAISA